MFPHKEDIQKALRAALSRGAEFAEVYLEKRIADTVRIEEQLVRESSRGVLAGVGIRAILGDKIGYAYADGLGVEGMVEAAAIAGEIAATGEPSEPVGLSEARVAEPFSETRIFPIDVEAEKKVELAFRADASCRDYDPRITQAMVTLLDHDKHILIANSEGTYIGDRQILTTLRVVSIAESNGGRQRGFRSLSGRSGYELFEKESPEEVAADASRQAVILLDAQEAPAGAMVVVLGNGRGGVLLHEAIGHGFEGDFIRKKTSLFTGRIGEKVAVEGCTIVDDGTIPNARGSINIDDEGTPGERTVLIENGILKGFIYDKLNARLMGTVSTGNGRRQAYKFMPVPRQTNTFMLAGEAPPEDIIGSVAKGLYAKNIGGGQVDIASGNFVFEVTEGYLIEGGKVGAPVRGANLIGNGAEVLKKIEMIGNDFAFEAGGGTCGKRGQAVPVMDGIPTVKISNITVGGTES
ncbi:MAG: metallopeptidase TldD-related protein [bacterium]